MKCTAHFYKLNYDFSPEFAEAHHNGEASENNRKYDWEDELLITNEVDKIEVQENSIYILEGEKNGEKFAEELSEMTIFKVSVKDGPDVSMACSQSILSHYNIEEKEKSIVLKVFLEEKEPLTNPVPGIYIALQDFPKHLIN